MLASALEGDDAETKEKADTEELRGILESADLLLACWDYLMIPEGILRQWAARKP